MAPDLMTQTQESAAQWKLSPGEAVRLAAAPVPRVVAVTSGRLWLTRSDRPDDLVPDVWLAAGQSTTLGPDEEAVVEAWPLAQFEVLEAPAAAPRRFSAARAASWARPLRERLQWAPAQQACRA
jgi:hypothetical protein